MSLIETFKNSFLAFFFDKEATNNLDNGKILNTLLIYLSLSLFALAIFFPFLFDKLGFTWMMNYYDSIYPYEGFMIFVFVTLPIILSALLLSLFSKEKTFKEFLNIFLSSSNVYLILLFIVSLFGLIPFINKIIFLIVFSFLNILFFVSLFFQLKTIKSNLDVIFDRVALFFLLVFFICSYFILNDLLYITVVDLVLEEFNIYLPIF